MTRPPFEPEPHRQLLVLISHQFLVEQPSPLERVRPVDAEAHGVHLDGPASVSRFQCAPPNGPSVAHATARSIGVRPDRQDLPADEPGARLTGGGHVAGEVVGRVPHVAVEAHDQVAGRAPDALVEPGRHDTLGVLEHRDRDSRPRRAASSSSSGEPSVEPPSATSTSSSPSSPGSRYRPRGRRRGPPRSTSGS